MDTYQTLTGPTAGRPVPEPEKWQKIIERETAARLRRLEREGAFLAGCLACGRQMVVSQLDPEVLFCDECFRTWARQCVR